MTLQTFRERLVLVLLALLPFHALFVTVMTKSIQGSGHAPLPMFAVWKEGLLLMILGIACIEILKKRSMLRFDIFDAIVGLFGFLSVMLFFANDQSLGVFALGLKYDLIPLISFLVLRRVEWSDQFQKLLISVLIAVGCIVALYGIVAEFLPLRFFVWLGYSDLHSLYSANGPLAAFQELEGGMMRRAQSVMSGPNQLGLWLLIPLGCLLGQWSNNRVASGKWLVVSIMILVALVLSFSRAAWIAAVVMIAFTFIRSTNVLHCRKFCMVILGFFACFALAVAFLFPSVFFRINSSSDHLRKPVEAIRMMIKNPLGLGLGTAGPASNRMSDTCVQLPKDADFSWAKDRQDLCVFVDSVQVQPSDRVCSCPLLTENWYLQIGVELGVIGFVLYLLLTIFVLKRLADSDKRVEHNELPATRYPLPAFFGLSIAALFLHAFEDGAVAYTVWVLLAVAFATLDSCHRKSSRSQVRS